MTYGDVTLHNAAELCPDGALQRCPERVRLLLNERAREKMQMPAGVEIRYVSDAPRSTVTISTDDGAAYSLYFGPYLVRSQTITSAGEATVEVEMPDMLRRLADRAAAPAMFDPRVVRVLFGPPRQSRLRVLGVNGRAVRSPEPHHLPRRTMLAYGTSITHGASASAPHLTYVSLAARSLGVDVLNLGVGGACHAEPELADYFAERDDWDAALVCLSVNMIGAGFSLEAFADRVGYMVRTLAATGKPVYAVTIYPHFRDVPDLVNGPSERENPELFRQALRDVVDDLGAQHVVLLEGPELLRDWHGLTPDLIHPSDHGMIDIGYRLAESIRTSRPWRTLAADHLKEQP